MYIGDDRGIASINDIAILSAQLLKYAHRMKKPAVRDDNFQAL